MTLLFWLIDSLPGRRFPDVWIDYSSFEPLVTDSFVEMGMKSFAFEVRRENAEINAPTDRTKWFMTPQTINASVHLGSFTLYALVPIAGLTK